MRNQHRHKHDKNYGELSELIHETTILARLQHFECNRLFSTVTQKPVIISGMNVRLTVFVTALCWSVGLHGQDQPSGKIPFAGCYEVVSQTGHPGNEDASPIPSRFQLRRDQADKRSTDFFQMRSIPTGQNDWERLWLWQPKGDSVWLSWGRGLGGFRGALKQQRNGEFIGQIKEWCDSRCEWKRRTAKIRIRKIECAE
jgi:hypothetical protein